MLQKYIAIIAETACHKDIFPAENRQFCPIETKLLKDLFLYENYGNSKLSRPHKILQKV